GNRIAQPLVSRSEMLGRKSMDGAWSPAQGCSTRGRSVRHRPVDTRVPDTTPWPRRGEDGPPPPRDGARVGRLEGDVRSPARDPHGARRIRTDPARSAATAVRSLRRRPLPVLHAAAGPHADPPDKAAGGAGTAAGPIRRG